MLNKQPTTGSPTNKPTSLAPTTSSPTMFGMGYCSHNPTMQCLSTTDCNGCQVTRRDRNLRNRQLAKPACGDGTCRKTCSQCIDTLPDGPECNASHPDSCLTLEPTTSNPVSAPTLPPMTSNPSDAPTREVCLIVLYSYYIALSSPPSLILMYFYPLYPHSQQTILQPSNHRLDPVHRPRVRRQHQK